MGRAKSEWERERARAREGGDDEDEDEVGRKRGGAGRLGAGEVSSRPAAAAAVVANDDDDDDVDVGVVGGGGGRLEDVAEVVGGDVLDGDGDDDDGDGDCDGDGAALVEAGLLFFVWGEETGAVVSVGSRETVEGEVSWGGSRVPRVAAATASGDGVR